MAATVGSLRVDLGLNSADFQAGMGKAEAAMSNFGRSAAAVGKATEAVGATSARVMARQVNLAFQLQDVGVSLAGGMNPLMVAAQQGSQILGIYGMGQGGLGAALRDLGSMATGLASKLWPVAAVLGVASAGIAAMTGEINKSAGATVGFGDVALATWQLFAEGVYGIVQPAIEAIGGWFSGLWGMIAPAIATAVNGIIGGFVGAFEAIKATWAQLPAALADLIYQAAESTVNGVISMIREVQVSINRFISEINTGLASVGSSVRVGGKMDLLGYADLGNPFAGAAASTGAAASSAFAGAQQDYLGGWASAVGERARANIAAAKTETEGLGGAARAANDNFKSLGDTALEVADTWTGDMKSAWSGLFSELKNGLLQGKDLWETFSKAAMGALDKITSKALDMAMNGIFDMLFGGFGTIGSGGVGIPKGGFIPGLTGPKLPSFAGGGFTGAGARSGGLDGKGGFLAMMHPNESVLDHNMQASRAGSASLVRVELSGDLEARILSQSAGQSVQIVQAAAPGIAEQGASGAGSKLAGGDFDRSMGRFGVAPQAKRR